MSGTFFTSDPHFGHERIIEYSKRPFDTVEQMNRVLIERWNAVVAPGDTVYLLGDVFLHVNQAQALDIRHQLHGSIHLIIGNHDQIATKIPQAWASMKDQTRVNFKEPVHCQIMLNHFAMRTWSGSHKGSWHLYGHSHGSLPEDPTSLSFDVGVDCWDFTPISLQTVMEKMHGKLRAKAEQAGWLCDLEHSHPSYEAAWACMETRINGNTSI